MLSCCFFYFQLQYFFITQTCFLISIASKVSSHELFILINEVSCAVIQLHHCNFHCRKSPSRPQIQIAAEDLHVARKTTVLQGPDKTNSNKDVFDLMFIVCLHGFTYNYSSLGAQTNAELP